MEKKIIVFDFDNTLINFDSTEKFYKFCSKERDVSFLYTIFFYFLKVLSKFRIISVRKEKELGLKMFCPSNIEEFKMISERFASTIQLNHLYEDFFLKYQINKNDIIIASASFYCYLRLIFPKAKIYATTLKVDKKGRIEGILEHPFRKEKKKILLKNGFSKIDLFFTDSKKDIYTARISKKVFWVKNGEIINY